MADAAPVRFFPQIADLLADGGWRRDAPHPGSTFLQLAGVRLSPLKRWSGRFLGPVERVTMLLRAYREATEAEAAGRFARADFCWRELKRRLAAAWPADVWTASALAARRDFAMPEAAGTEIRDAFARVLIETFVAFYWLYARGDAPDGFSRASLHRQYAASMFDLCNASTEDIRRTLVAMLDTEFQIWTKLKNWDRAVEVAGELVRRVQDDIGYEDMLVFSIQARAVGRMSNESGEVAARKNADVLRRAIDELQKLRGVHPSNATIYSALASLTHIRAVQLAISGAISDALVEAETAAAYNAEEENVDETRESLKQLMTQRQQAVKELLARVAAMPNARLNATGHAMRADANKGFGPLESFSESGKPVAIANAATEARAKTIFRRVGLPIPSAGDVVSDADDLAAGLWDIMSSPPENADAVPAAWRAAVGKNPALAAYPPETVRQYLARRLFGGEEKVAFEGPAIDIPTPSRRRSVEPFGRWLFSNEGPLAKGFLAAALVVLFWTSAASIRTTRNAAAQDAAFARIEAAVAAHDDAATIAAAEDFYKTTDSRRDNERQTHAMAHYAEAMARWFLRNPGPPDANAIQRVAEYNRIAHHLQPAEVTP